MFSLYIGFVALGAKVMCEWGRAGIEERDKEDKSRYIGSFEVGDEIVEKLLWFLFDSGVDSIWFFWGDCIWFLILSIMRKISKSIEFMCLRDEDHLFIVWYSILQGNHRLIIDLIEVIKGLWLILVLGIFWRVLLRNLISFIWFRWDWGFIWRPFNWAWVYYLDFSWRMLFWVIFLFSQRINDRKNSWHHWHWCINVQLIFDWEGLIEYGWQFLDLCCL